MATNYSVPVTFIPAFIDDKVVYFTNVGGQLSLAQIPDNLITETKLSADVTTKLNRVGQKGDKGDKGDPGQQGPPGPQGPPGSGGSGTDLTPRVSKLESKTSAIELKQLDPIALPSNEDVKFAVALPDGNGVVTDPAPSEYVKLKVFQL